MSDGIRRAAETGQDNRCTSTRWDQIRTKRGDFSIVDEYLFRFSRRLGVEVADGGTLACRLDRAALRGPEVRYMLRTNLAADDPELIWRCYMQLCFVEEAFSTLKDDLGLRPVYH